LKFTKNLVLKFHFLLLGVLQLSAYTTNVQHSSSYRRDASGVVQITGSNTVIFAVLEASFMSPLQCVLY